MSLPTFPKHPPESPAFWDVRFDADFTPWQRERVPPELLGYLANRGAGKVLIPGCGTGVEVDAFVEARWQPLAVDFSASAVARAQRNLGPRAALIQQRDFFDPALTEAGFGCVYECAFMCALPLHLRAPWARQIEAILPSQGQELIGMFYIGSTERGPPFAIEREALFSLLFAFELIEESISTEQPAPFGENERWMCWRRR